MPPSGVDYASEFLNGYAPEYVPIIAKKSIIDFLFGAKNIMLSKPINLRILFNIALSVKIVLSNF